MATNNTQTLDAGRIVFGATEPVFFLELFTLLFYGAYTMLFGLYVFLQIHQRGRQRIYQVSLLILYLLAIAAVAVSILAEKQMTQFILNVALTGDINDPFSASHFLYYANLGVAEDGIYVAANTVADALLLYRCYVVWASRKYVIVAPVFISLINTVIAIIAANLVVNNAGRLLKTAGVENKSLRVADIISVAFLAVNLFTNLVLTGLIAGRIWWIARNTRQSLGIDNSDKSINSITALVLESGLLYPVALVIALAVQGTVDITPILTQIVGIAPTLIIVRTDLGISIENADSTNPDETVALYDLETSGSSDPYGPQTEKAYTSSQKPSERKGYGFRMVGAKGRALSPDTLAGIHPSRETTTLSPPNSSLLDVLPPTFFETQNEGTSRLITSGPRARLNEKYHNQGLVVLNPPTIK